LNFRFFSGEGCFLISIFKTKTHKIGKQVNLTFKITQNERDKNLMELIIKYLNCGILFKIGTCFDLRVYKFSDVNEKMRTFFEKYPIKGVKHLDYLYFYKLVKLMSEDSHITNEGLEKIQLIKAKMNKGRK